MESELKWKHIIRKKKTHALEFGIFGPSNKSCWWGFYTFLHWCWDKDIFTLCDKTSLDIRYRNPKLNLLKSHIALVSENNTPTELHTITTIAEINSLHKCNLCDYDCDLRLWCWWQQERQGQTFCIGKLDNKSENLFDSVSLTHYLGRNNQNSLTLEMSWKNLNPNYVAKSKFPSVKW